MPPQRRPVLGPRPLDHPGQHQCTPDHVQPPYTTSTTAPAHAATSSTRRGTPRPHGRTSARASTAPITFSTPAIPASHSTVASPFLASSSSRPPSMSIPAVPPNAQ